MAAVADSLPHAIRVTRMYRQVLRTVRSWSMTHETHRNNCLAVRDRFDENKNEHNPVKIQRLLDYGAAELKKYRHPIPYTFPTSPDGSKWERNIPPHHGACRMTATEYEWFYGVKPPADYHLASDEAHH